MNSLSKSSVNMTTTPGMPIDRQTQVDEQLMQVKAAIAEMSQALPDLQKRLSPVIDPNQTDDRMFGSTPEVMICPLADTLRGCANELFALSSAIRQLTCRIEL